MASTRKRKKINRRVVRKSPEPLTKLDQHYIALHECYKAAKKAGFSNEVAWFLVQEPATMPEWITEAGGIIPRIDPTEDEDNE